jgi:hypothetical protein
VHQAVRHLGRCHGTSLLEEHAELVTAESSERVLCSQTRGHSPHGNLQHVVATW